MDQQRVEGTVVACERRGYSSFEKTRPDGSKECVAGGFTMWVWLVEDFGASPTPVKIGNADRSAFEAFEAEGKGCVVALLVELHAKNRGVIERRFVVQVPVVAGNGAGLAHAAN